MNKTIIVVIIAILVLAGGAGIYLSKRSTKPPADQSKNKDQKTPEAGNSALTSLKDLISMGKSQMCTYETADARTGTTKGTVYIAGSKMRGDFTMTTKDNKSTTGSMINDGTYMYSWTSEMKQGIKTKMTEELKQEAENAQKNPQQYVDPNVKINYNCQGWIGDTSKFTPPADIKFMDFSSTMPPKGNTLPDNNGGPDQKTQQCAACDYLQGEQQAQCKQSLGCN